MNTSSVLIAGNSEQIEPLFERIDNIILKCYHLNIKGVLPVAMIPRNNLRYKNTANLPGLAVFLCAVFSSIISYIILVTRMSHPLRQYHRSHRVCSIDIDTIAKLSYTIFEQ